MIGKSQSSAKFSSSMKGCVDMRGVMGLMVVIIIGVVFVELFSPFLRDAITDAATDVETVTTGVAETTGIVTLATQHWFSDETSLAVTCATDTAPGFLIAADRVTVNLTGLTVSTVQVCTTSFLTESTDDFVNIVKIVPLFAGLAIVGASFLAIGIGAGAARGKAFAVGGKSLGSGGIDTNAFLTALVGIVLIGTVTQFTDAGTLEYANQPEFSGIGAILSLVVIGYVLAAISVLIGGGATALRGR